MVLALAKQIGDTDPTIPQAKIYLRRFRYGRGLGATPVYTELFGSALRTFAVARNAEIDRGAKGPMRGESGTRRAWLGDVGSGDTHR